MGKSRNLMYERIEYTITLSDDEEEYVVSRFDPDQGQPAAIGAFQVARTLDGALRPVAARLWLHPSVADSKFLLALAQHALDSGLLPFE